MSTNSHLSTSRTYRRNAAETMSETRAGNQRRKTMQHRYYRHMLIGYARVSTADQNPDHQTDALARAGVDPANIYLDHASGAKASRPELDKALASANRAGDQLVITRLDRLGRSLLHLVTLGAALRERGVGLRVLEQGIDTTTAEVTCDVWNALRPGRTPTRTHRRQHPRRARRRPRPRANRRKTPEAHRRPGPTRPAALRRGNPYGPTHRRPPPSPALHHLRAPQQGKHRTAPRRQSDPGGLALIPSPLLPRPRLGTLVPMGRGAAAQK
ncbi:DNA integration/recombination/inversion protein [Renibacterium salmoninarum ATCC 33209]|uniref:DNA integration/recombination/inversion protein n=1 Tax=Renibacterium salmoninarum (strain ATCC 33209 / DSM 20767 / JCM 11484 / NBRC 15589 / NCIMB 2235) TaxID=288705 RepID=A9WQS1_RENSM|nr:DNA integration/recombination/inversion protein [Renibacterium salmoninarum ATCC 33209]